MSNLTTAEFNRRYPHLAGQHMKPENALYMNNPGFTIGTCRSTKKQADPQIFIAFCKVVGIPVPIPEYKFHPTRKWRADFAWPEHKIMLEVEGGVWTGGRHTRGSGFVRDMEKYNAAAALGWCIFRVTPDKLLKTDAVVMIKQAIEDQA